MSLIVLIVVTQYVLCTAYLRDVTAEVQQYWKRIAPSLPAVGELAQYLDKPLPERAKVPVEGFRFHAILPTALHMEDRTTRKDLEMHIRLDERERAEGFFQTCWRCILATPPSYSSAT